MLNIPDSIKNLFKQDSVRKNFRVIFPNGEFRDLTNTDIESETVSLTESINSSAVIKFGLCESPVMEFVCHGLPNVKGKTIQCQLEVDVSSIPANERPEGVKTSQDVPYPYYIIPYGVYKVKTCKRDGDTDKRTIVAYNKLAYYDWMEVTDFEHAKFCLQLANNENYVLDFIKHYSEKFNTLFTDTEPIEDEYLHYYTTVDDESVETDVLNWFPTFVRDCNFNLLAYGSSGGDGNDNWCMRAKKYTTSSGGTIYTHNEKVIELRPWIKQRLSNRYSQYLQTGCLYKSSNELDEIKFNQAFNDMISQIQTYYPEFVDYFRTIKEKLRMCLNPHAVKAYTNKSFGYNPQPVYDFLTTSRNSLLVYPNDEAFSSYTGSNEVAIHCPTGFMLDIYELDSEGHLIEEHTFNYENILSNTKLYRYEFNSSFIKSYPRKYNPAEEYPNYHHAFYDAKYLETHEDFSNTREFIESYIELLGLFGTFDRYGNFKVIDLTDELQLYPSDTLYPSNTLYPRAQQTLVTKSMYSRIEYEDTPTRHYDKIECTWRDGNNTEHNQEYQIVDTASLEWYDPDDFQQYNLSENYFIKNGYYTDAEVDAILESLGEKIKDFQYYPANIEMRGLPYLEAGDALAVVTRMSGFTTFILRRTMNGIQELKDNIEAEM